MVKSRTVDYSLEAACGALTALVLENGELRREVKQLRHQVSKLAKKLHRKGVELERRGVVGDVREERGKKEEVAVVEAEVAPVPVAEVPEPVVAEPLAVEGVVAAGVAPAIVAEVPEPVVAEPPVAVSVEEMEEEEEFGVARIVLPDGGEEAVRGVQTGGEMLRMLREEEERKEREWKVVEGRSKKRKVEVVTAPVGPRLWCGRGAVAVVGDVLDVVPRGPRAARNYMYAQGGESSLGSRGRGPIAGQLPRVQRDFEQAAPWRERLRRR